MVFTSSHFELIGKWCARALSPHGGSSTLSRAVSRKQRVNGGEQIRGDGTFADKSVGSCFDRRQLHALLSVDTESDQPQPRETAPDAADQPQPVTTRQGEIDYG